MDINSLPKVSIITPTHNRVKCMKLALINYKLIDYPREKLEWIIIDDGDYDIADKIPRDDTSIKYYHFNPYCKAQLHKDLKSSLKKKANQVSTNKKAKKFKMRNMHHQFFYKGRLPLGMKRNIANQYATGDIIFHMDDDDLYYKDCVVNAVKELMKNPEIKCIGSIITGVFHTTRYISMAYSRKDTQHRSKQVFENTLCYYKSFWNERKFDNQDINYEAHSFLKKRLHQFKLYDSKDKVVSLQHSGNMFKIPNFENELKDKEPNGWHFQMIPDEIFILITSLDN